MDEILDEKTYETRKIILANFTDRTLAFLADLLIFVMFSFGLNLVLKITPTYLLFILAFWWQILIVISLYFIFFNGSESNATLGKQIMNIRLLTEDKRDVDYTTSVKHFLFSIVLFFGYFSLLSKENKTMADKICKVIVVKVK